MRELAQDARKKGEINMNVMKLKAKLVELSKTYEDCAKALNISITAFSNKMNGTSSFKLVEAKALSDFLGLTQSEVFSIFFGKELA